MSLTGKDSSFKYPKEDTANKEFGIGPHKSLAHSYDAPEEHQSAQPRARSNFPQYDIAGNFEENVRDKKNHGCHIILSPIHVEIFRETLDLCVANVDSVEESKRVDEKEDWKEVKVNLEQELILRSGGDFRVPRTLKSIRYILFSSDCTIFRSDILVGGIGRGRHVADDCRTDVEKASDGFSKEWHHTQDISKSGAGCTSHVPFPTLDQTLLKSQYIRLG